jgi:two-component system LytT family response regulator
MNRIFDLRMSDFTDEHDRDRNNGHSAPLVVGEHDVASVANEAANESVSGILEKVQQLEQLLAKPSRIAIKTGGKIVFIDISEVRAAEAQGNYVLLQRQPDSYLLRVPISELAEKLEPYGFVRIHRSVLVNASFVLEIEPSVAGSYILRVIGGKEYTVSRTYKANLKSLAQFWVGTDETIG